MKRIFAFLLLGLLGCASSKAIVNKVDTSPSVKKGDVLVYKTESEICNERGNKEILNEYTGTKDRVKWSTTHWKKKIVSADDGMLYGQSLSVGLKLGQDPLRDDNMYCNYVEKIEDVIVPAGTFTNCFKIVEATLPDAKTEWYCPGVGIVKSEYHHHGTITNEWGELVKIVRR